MLEILHIVGELSDVRRPVVLYGERGTGKELIAHRLHYLSAKWAEPFIKVNCGAISESLLDAQLFGAEAGAYTGSRGLLRGYFERAQSGTLFLDEISHASATVQQKLLRVLEYGEYERLGGQSVLRTEARIVAATNKDLDLLCASGEFLPDLRDRLSFMSLTIPPLRSRREDIVLLANHFASSFALEFNRPEHKGFSNTDAAKLEEHHWPGNVRELRNVAERAVFLSTLGFFQPEAPSHGGDRSSDCSAQVPPGTPKMFDDLEGLSVCADKMLQGLSRRAWKATWRELEREVLERGLERARFQQKRAAQQMGMTYNQLRALMRKHDLTPDRS